jgi:poly-beta-1,6-N-acetyl-D-glucosamine synthase
MQRKIVVIVPAHNEAGQVGATLTAICGQSRPPDEIYVSVDNNDDHDVGNQVAVVASRFPGVIVTSTVRNEHRKAGNLNGILSRVLPQLRDTDVVINFDADSVPGLTFIEKALDWLERFGAVGATFHGRAGGGILGQLQRSEFARFARHQQRRLRCDVLSGTGSAFRVSVLRKVAASRADGQVYDVASLTEDYELTLRIRSLGENAVAPADCLCVTDVMTTVGEWMSQRLRWQVGTLLALYRYGWSKHTREMILRQSLCYLFMIITPLTVVYMAWSFALFGLAGINPANAPVYMAGVCFVIAEQAWQSRKAGRKAVLITLLIVPDFLYSLGRQAVYIRALYRIARRKGAGWGAGTSI